MSDEARRVAFDERAPPDERFDAQSELQKAHAPTSIPYLGDWKVAIDAMREDMDEQELAKAQGRAQVIPFPGEDRRVASKGQKSVFLDKYQIFARGEFFEKPAPVGFEAMRTMVDQTPILAAILLTRQRQINRFCEVSEDGGMGFAIRHRDHAHEITPDEQVSVALLERFFQHCGWEGNPRQRRRLRRDSFQQFVAKLVRDTLTMDAAAIETEIKRDAARGIDGLYAVDGSTIRLCDEEGYQGDDEFFAVQVIQGQVRTAYTWNNLIYEPRNPRADIRVVGYGMSECELLIRIVTGFLNALTLNIKGFTDNAIPRGIMHLSGDYGAEDLSAFKRHWNQMVKGINNAWSLPLMVSKDMESKAEFAPIGVDFNEMYFSKWMTFLTAIACAIYGISPDEINFESFSAQKSSLSGEDTTEKLADSKDKGLRPLLGYFESIFSDHICADFDEKYVFRFVGLDPKDAEKEWEGKKLVMTVNELRAEEGMDALPGLMGDAPLNPNLMGLYMQENAPQQPEPDFGGVPAAGGRGQPGAPAQEPGTDGDLDDDERQNTRPFQKAFPRIWTL
jgi:hypothetical protein